MDHKNHEEHHGKWFKTFNGENDITVVPYQGITTQDPDFKDDKKFSIEENQYLSQTAIVMVDNLAKKDQEIVINRASTTFGEKMKAKENIIRTNLIVDISHINNN